MTEPRKLVIVGTGAFAEIACAYFSSGTTHDVAAFAVERAYLNEETLLDRPVVPFETVETLYSPKEHDVFVAIVYTQLNRLRRRLLDAAQAKGYGLASYVSPHAFIGPQVRLGEHCFVFENNVIQPFVTVGDNVVLWSGNHIGHHSTIEDDVFVSSHVVVSGFCRIGTRSFLGVNAAIGDRVSIGADCWLGPGVCVTRDVPENQILRAPEPEPSKVSARRFFKIRD